MRRVRWKRNWSLKIDDRLNTDKGTKRDAVFFLFFQEPHLQSLCDHKCDFAIHLLSPLCYLSLDQRCIISHIHPHIKKAWWQRHSTNRILKNFYSAEHKGHVTRLNKLTLGSCWPQTLYSYHLVVLFKDHFNRLEIILRWWCRQSPCSLSLKTSHCEPM